MKVTLSLGEPEQHFIYRSILFIDGLAMNELLRCRRYMSQKRSTDVGLKQIRVGASDVNVHFNHIPLEKAQLPFLYQVVFLAFRD